EVPDGSASATAVNDITAKSAEEVHGIARMVKPRSIVSHRGRGLAGDQNRRIPLRNRTKKAAALLAASNTRRPTRSPVSERFGCTGATARGTPEMFPTSPSEGTPPGNTSSARTLPGGMV